MKVRLLSALIAGSSLGAPLAAETAPMHTIQPDETRSQAASSADRPLARFAPASQLRDHRIDYTHWDEALAWFVVPMGPSVRQSAGRAEPPTGTRRIYGHESRLRLEGNRVAFSYLTPEIIQSLTDYRADLERIGSQLDLSRIPRNEQLAFWINLHNVALIEALARQYPLTQPGDRKFGPNSAALDDAKLITVDGVDLSPRDIREHIVYPNWSDPKVIYGFWRGVIGGPSIQRLAFTGGNVDALLALSAEEFVNSLRGVEKWGGALRVSPIYAEAAPFYFDQDDALRAHLSQYAAGDVKDLLSKTGTTAYKNIEQDIADLSGGEPMTFVNFVCQGPVPGAAPGLIDEGNCLSQGSRPNLAIQRLMTERSEKLRRAAERGIRTGMVIYGDGGYVEGEVPVEVE